MEPINNLKDYECIYRKMVMYKELNSTGTIFGGTLVSWMDEASALFVRKKTKKNRTVTKKISELVFEQPANLGDFLEIWCKCTHMGKTSMTVDVVVVRHSEQQKSIKETNKGKMICQSEFVFVCVNGSGRPELWLT